MEDGVVILTSKGPVIDDVQQPTEYRVAYVTSVPSIFGEVNDSTTRYDPNPDYILDNFFECDVYTNGDDAHGYADILANTIDHEMEYGVILISLFQDREFSSY